MEFDRKLPFGTVYGDPNIGFAQNGNHYKHDESLFEAGKRQETLTLKPQAEQWAKAPRE